MLKALKYCIIKKIYRNAKKGVAVSLDIASLAITEVTTEEILQYKEIQQTIESEVAKLPLRMREIYMLSRVDLLSITEIAQHLNISEQTVKNTLTSALKRLRDKLLHFGSAFVFFL